FRSTTWMCSGGWLMSVGSVSGAGGADADAADAAINTAARTSGLTNMAVSPCFRALVAARIRRGRAVGAIDVELVIALVVALTVDSRQRDVTLLQHRRGLEPDVAVFLLQAHRRGLERARRRRVHRPQRPTARIAVGVRLDETRIPVRHVRVETLRERR